MATEDQYVEKIKNFSWQTLGCLWRSIKERHTPGWENGKAFEYMVLQAFRLEGAEVRWPYRVRLNGTEIEQIDGIIYIDGFACLTECKDYDRNVNFEPISKIRSQLMRRPVATIASIFSSSDFTEPAVTLANFIQPQTILLWNGREVEYCIHRKAFSRSLINKYRKCVEFGIHDYDVTIEDEL
ncbi:hypothetical protein DENIS_3266 [Desulfonema ishimotonii]|uniref:Restriction endonuclease type IV Mrr domain-containing protein n=1 Tax=Desulfonema ishimotonii TaxID=45657 RepID=A0A401FZC3_9BACT|nr:restriction endonuclease [Desulfonema ishimotonii]GBC62297.1 hypothetical protein DENIS_3266 [Desulfonema ishimotonii]